jgi:hypothetical protein
MKNKFFALPFFVIPMISFATLGQGIASINQDNKKIASNKNERVILDSTNGYQIFTINAKHGIIIKEYLNANNKVFAISWAGHRYPDFPQLLGTYTEILKTGHETHYGIHLGKISGNDFVISILSLQGHISGVAYVPSLIPSITNSSQLQLK